jgi:hypothetical protein
MAINVDYVYKTVLSILNKEQRGNITPDEFNKVATQVQLDIFERYFDDLNQQIRVDQTSREYADRVLDVDEKIAVFKVRGDCDHLGNGVFRLPVSYNGTSTNGTAVYKLGVVTYNDPSIGDSVEIERLTSKQFYENQRSDLTRSSRNFPTYIYENETQTDRKTITVSPSTITNNVVADFIRKPKDVKWSYNTGTLGQLLYNSSFSVDFELNGSETVNVITRILAYSGVILEDPQIVQVAASKTQQDEINQKS